MDNPHFAWKFIFSTNLIRSTIKFVISRSAVFGPVANWTWWNAFSRFALKFTIRYTILFQWVLSYVYLPRNSLNRFLPVKISISEWIFTTSKFLWFQSRFSKSYSGLELVCHLSISPSLYIEAYQASTGDNLIGILYFRPNFWEIVPIYTILYYFIRDSLKKNYLVSKLLFE